MEFFKGIGNKISKTGQDAIKKTKELADTSKLNSEISQEEKRISKICETLGRQYYDKYKNDENNEFEEYIVQISEAFEKIEKYEQEIKYIKGKITCPNCGADMDVNTVFCSMCGSKMPEIVNTSFEEQDVEQTEEQIEINEKFCANCGEKLEIDAAFCPSCGTKVE